MRTDRFLHALGAAALLAVSGCGGEDGESDPGDAKLGGFGVLEFVVTPERDVVEGENRFQVAVHDARTHAPFAVDMLSAEPLMGSMGHPSPTEPEVSAQGDGLYELDHVVFSMPGVWELRLRASKGDVYDDAAFTFDVP